MSRKVKDMIVSVVGEHSFRSDKAYANSLFTVKLSQATTVVSENDKHIELARGTEVTVFRKPTSKAPPRTVLATFTPPGRPADREGFWRVFCDGSARFVVNKSLKSSFRPTKTRRTPDDNFY